MAGRGWDEHAGVELFQEDDGLVLLLLWRAPATRALIEERRAGHYALFWPGLACTSGIAWSRLAKCSFEGVDTPFVEDF